MVDVRQVISELFFRDRTGDGTRSAAENLRMVGDAAGASAVATENAEKSSRSVERSYANLQRRLAPLQRLQERYERDQRTLNQAQSIGRINAQQYREQIGRLSRDFDQARRRIEATERAQMGVNRSFRAFAPLANAARGAVAGFVAAFSIRELTQGSRQAVRDLDAIAKAARSLDGIGSADFLQSNRFSLGEVGFEFNEADKIVTTLNKRVGELRNGFGALQQPLSRIAPELADALIVADTAEERFDVFVRGLERIEDRSERAAIAAAGLDASFGKRFGAAIEAGADGLAEARDRARELGLVIDQDVLRRAEQYNDEFAQSAQIVQANLRRTFVELAPLINSALEGVANITSGIRERREQRDARSILQNRRGEDVDRLRFARDQLQDELRAAQERLAQLRQQGVDAVVLGNNEAANALLSQRLTLIQDEISLREVQAVTLRDIREELGLIDETGGGVSNDAITAAQERLRLAQERQAAAEGGQQSLTRFDDEARIAALADQNDLVGEQRALFIELERQTAAVNAETARLTDGFNGAARAAATIKVDPLDRVNADITSLERLIRVANNGPLETAEQRVRIEREILNIERERGRVLVGNERDAARARLEERDNQQQRLEEAIGRGGDDEIEDLGRRFEDRFLDVSDRFWDNFARTGELSFRSLGRDITGIFRDALISPVRNFVNRTIQGIFTGGPFTPGINGPNPGNVILNQASGGLFGGVGNAAGGFFGGIGNAVGGLFGGIGVGSALGGIFGGGGAAAGGLFGGAPLLGGAGSFASAALGPIGLGFAGGQLISDLFGLEGRARRGVNRAGLGAGIGFTVGGPLGALAGAAIGGLSSLFGNGPSREPVNAVFDIGQGRDLGIGQVRDNEASAENRRILEGLVQQSLDVTRALTALTGGSFSDDLSTRRNEAFLNIALDNESILVGFQGADGNTTGERRFQSNEQGGADAVREIVRLTLDRLEGGDQALVAASRQIANNDQFDVGEIVGRIESLSTALADANERVDPFAQRLDQLISAFDGLDRSSGQLAEAFGGAINRLSERFNDDEARILRDIVNPLAGRVQEVIDERTARREAAESIAGEGGNVDFTLLNRVSERRVLALFNLEERLGRAVDAVRFSVTQFRDNQRREIEALQLAIDSGLAPASSFDFLLRTQAAERNQFVNGLSDEDRLRLAGELDDFEDLGGRLAGALTEVNDQVERRLNRIDELIQEADQRIADRTQRRDAADQFLLDLDRRFFRGTPGQEVDALRTNARDIVDRAIADPTDLIARDNAFRTLDDFINRSRAVNTSSTQFDADLQLTRDLAQRLRDQFERERAAATQERDAILESRDHLRTIAEFFTRENLTSNDFNGLANQLREADPLIPLLREIADLVARQGEQNARLADSLAVIGPDEIGLLPADAIAPAPTLDRIVAGPVGASPIVIAPPAATRAGEEGGADMAEALLLMNRELVNISEILAVEAQRQRNADLTSNGYLAKLSEDPAFTRAAS